MTVGVDPIEVALFLARALDALGIVHTIGGSIASSIAGEPRSTVDSHHLVRWSLAREGDVRWPWPICA